MQKYSALARLLTRIFVKAALVPRVKWMSDLEQGCQGILRDMTNSRRLPEQLSEKECLLVARWAAKTAFVLNSSANYTIKVSEQQLKQLRERSDDLPWGIVVVATTSSFFNSDWMQSTRWQLCAPDNLTKRIASLMDTRTYKVAIQFGHMVLVVVWHAIPGWWMMLWRELAGRDAGFVMVRVESTGGANCNRRFCVRRRTYGKSTSNA
jgi:hypothetical protein